MPRGRMRGESGKNIRSNNGWELSKINSRHETTDSGISMHNHQDKKNLRLDISLKFQKTEERKSWKKQEGKKTPHI